MKITDNNIMDVFKSKKASVETMELKGYELIENLFCDSSGCGADNEPALTQSQLLYKLRQLLKEHNAFYTSITSEGQFQVYIGVFKKTGLKNCVKIANNTLEIRKEGKRIIRFHDTDILVFDAVSNTFEIFNGGFFTVTTKQRLNEFMPAYYSVTQKDFKWFLHDRRDGRVYPFINGMVMPC